MVFNVQLVRKWEFVPKELAAFAAVTSTLRTKIGCGAEASLVNVVRTGLISFACVGLLSEK